jgi:phosphoribosylanthranilate isomerase
MNTAPLVKICGVMDEAAVDAAVEHGVDFLGFVFTPQSPRVISPAIAAELCDALPDDVSKVGLFVDPSDDDLDHICRYVRLDYIQLHGSESPARVDEIRLNTGVAVIKAIGVATAEDIQAANAYDGHADLLLFDAKPPNDAPRAGGLGTAFPWPLMKSWTGETPWLLAGGLTPDNVARAIADSGAAGVDVSSGVEKEPGSKDPDRIAAFIKAAKGAGSGRW